MSKSLKQRFRKTIMRKRKRNMKKTVGGAGGIFFKKNKEVEITACDINITEIKNQLQRIGIKPLSSNKKELAKETKSDMSTFDNINKTTKQVENAAKLLKIVGCLVPGVSNIVGLGLAVITGVSNITKSKELTYLASQCLKFVSSVSKDFAEMSTFYSLPYVKNKNIVMDQALYDVLQKNLYTFLFFLIDSIDFVVTPGVTLQQYQYWYTFLLKVDFNEDSDYTKSIIPGNYRYSCKQCIPKGVLRKKLITSKSKQFITLEKPEDIISRISKKITNQDVKLYDTCSEELIGLCKNYNDNIMRLIESNMYILINSAYKYQTSLPVLKYLDKSYSLKSSRSVSRTLDKVKKEDNLYELSVKFSNAVFSTGLISEDVLEELKKFLDEVKNYDKQHSSSDLEFSFFFLIELNRIISELKYSDYTKGNTLLQNVGKTVSALPNALIYQPIKTYLSNPKLQYDILIREYALMTGNFLTMTSRYVLNYNQLSEEDKETINQQTKDKLKNIEGPLKILETNIDSIGSKVEHIASKLSETPESNAPTSDSTQAGGRTNYKKSYKHPKKSKTKQTKRKYSFL